MDRWSRHPFVQGVGMAGLGLVAGCGRLPGQATPQAKSVHPLAFLGTATPAASAELLAAFRIEGQNLLIDDRYASGNDQLVEAAAALVRLQPEVILIPGANAVPAVQTATTTIPIVNANANGTRDLVT